MQISTVKLQLILQSAPTLLLSIAPRLSYLSWGCSPEKHRLSPFTYLIACGNFVGASDHCQTIRQSFKLTEPL